MAQTSSIRPSASTTSNKEDLSVFDDVLFNEFVDGDQFDFSDSSYARSASATSGDSWFDEQSSGARETTGSSPSSPKDHDAGNKTFVLDSLDDIEHFPIDPLFDAATAQDSAPSTPVRADIGFRKLPSTVETVRKSQSCSVKKGDRRRRLLESPTKGAAEMSQPSSRRAQKEAWANQLERSVNPQALHSPLANRYAPMSPPPTLTQNRYQQQQQQYAPQPHHQQQQQQQQRLMSHSSLVSPLSQGFPQQQQQMSYFSPLATPLTSTYPNQPQSLSSFYQPLDPYFASPNATSSFPTFSNPFPSDDTAWEHDPILSSMSGIFPAFTDFPPTSSNTYGTHQSQNYNNNSNSNSNSNNNLYNDTKVQPWAPPPAQPSFYHTNQHPQHHQQMPQMPMSAPLASTQHQYYTHTTNPLLYPNPPHPQSAHPYHRTTSPQYTTTTTTTTHTYLAAPPLLSVPKTRRRPKPSQPDPDSDCDSNSDSDTDTYHRTRSSRSKTPSSPTNTRPSRKTRSPSRTRTRASSKAPTRIEVTTSSRPTTTSRSKSHHHNQTPLSPRSPRKQKSRTTSRREKGEKKDPFVNLTAQDSKKILTGVAPSGSSKTKAKRDKEEADKRRQFSEAATRAVREAGGDVKVLERVGLY